MGLFRQRGDAVETDIGQHRDRGAGRHQDRIPGLRIIKSWARETRRHAGAEEVSCGRHEKYNDHDAQARCERRIGPRPGFDSSMLSM